MIASAMTGLIICGHGHIPFFLFSGGELGHGHGLFITHQVSMGAEDVGPPAGIVRHGFHGKRGGNPPCKFKIGYSAKKLYLEQRIWLQHLNLETVSPETILRELNTGPYGRCVYRCDNDVVDHQIGTFPFHRTATGATRRRTGRSIVRMEIFE